MICTYANVNFEDHVYEVTGTPGNYDRSAWFNHKPTLAPKNPLINLPYIIDGERIITQSNACYTYLGRKFHLNGKNEDEITKVEQILNQVMDLRNDAAYQFYYIENPDYNVYLKNSASVHLGKFEAWFAHHKTKFSASDELTVADFHLWEMLDVHQALAKEKVGNADFLNQYPHLLDFHKRFKELPPIHKYIESPAYKYPINNKSSNFGSK